MPARRSKAGYALESFAENLEKEILPYLALMAKLVELLLHGTRKVRRRPPPLSPRPRRR